VAVFTEPWSERSSFLRFFLCTGFGVASCSLLRLFETITFACEDLGLVHEPINEGDDASGVREDLIPFAEGLVCRDDDGALPVAPGDDLEEQIPA
jgi:hypothetical protein